MVEVFQTNVENCVEADKLVALILHKFPGTQVNFDLEDCDKILRVEGKDFTIMEVMSVVSSRGFTCRLLEE